MDLHPGLGEGAKWPFQIPFPSGQQAKQSIAKFSRGSTQKERLRDVRRVPYFEQLQKSPLSLS